MAIQAQDIADMVKSTQADLGRLKWTDLGTDKLDFVAFKQLMNKERVIMDDGLAIQWNVVVGNSGGAQEVGLYGVDSTNVSDVLQSAQIPWRHTTATHSYDAREAAMNSGAAKVVDQVTIRRNDALTALPELIESRVWAAPPGSTDTLKMFGVPYWVSWVTSTGAFVGGDPTGHAAGAGGLAAAAFPRCQNWSATYTDVTKIDLMRKWRKASRQTAFKPPVQGASYGGMARYGYYTNDSVIGLLEEMLEAQNDNLGNDVASKDGQVMFKRTPVTHVPQLDQRAGNPIYGLDWSNMSFVVLKGWLLKESVAVSPTNHNVVNAFIDTSMNLRCTNRRQQFVLAVSDPTV